MDSATDFLFAKNVHSLGAGIPYPHYAPNYASTTAAAASHPANRFAYAFDQLQRILALRNRRGNLWALWELTKDQTTEHMVVIDQFVDPIVEAAVQRRKEALKEAGLEDTEEEKGKGGFREVRENESLLDYLVNYTSGESDIGRLCGGDNSNGVVG